jgi:hypothetical protein
MSNKPFIRFFIPLLFLVIVFSSCCSIRTINGVIEGNSSYITNESYSGAGPLPNYVIGYETQLCPGLFGAFYPNQNEVCNCLPGADKKPSEKLVLITGLNYSSQGGKYEEDNGVKGKIVTSYLRSPLLIKYKATSGFYAEAGLQPAVLLSAKDKYDGNTDDFKSHFKTFDLGIPVGFGYEFKNGIGIGAKVTPGILNVDKEKDDAEDEPNKTFSAGLKLSYSFVLKKKK